MGHLSQFSEVRINPTGATQCQQPHAARCELLQNRTASVVIDEDANRLDFAAKLHREPKIVKLPREMLCAISPAQVFAIVRFGVKDANAEHLENLSARRLNWKPRTTE